MIDPRDIRTPMDALNAAVEELTLLDRDVDGVGDAPAAKLTAWLAIETLERLRDNVRLRSPLAPDSLEEMKELRAYATLLEDRILELEKGRE